MLGKLLEENYIIETGFAPSTGGRRPLMYSLNTDLIYVVSVALDQLMGRIAIMDMQNNYVTGVEKFELPLQKNPAALSILINKIDHVINTSSISKEKIIGIGIGMPGFIDSKKGKNYSFLQTKDKSISDYISNIIGLPVFIDNDSSLIALAELRFGAARNKKNAMVINIGWGIGLGLILNGELFRGNDGFAGEFSHIPLFLNNKLCSCGKKGCLETETSLLVIAEKAKEGLALGKASILHKFSTNDLEQFTENILMAANDGDQFAIELLSEAGYNIGRGAAILIHILNPEIIILSGRGSSAGKIWQTPINQALNEHCIPKLSVNTCIEISSLCYEAELIGAAALVMENYEKTGVKKMHKSEAAFA
ncbi:MAG: ROK family protein [Chitinophagaceae bacterium]